MKYDDASWHYGGKFPADLPPEAGATHTGMYLAWALLSGMAGDSHIEEMPESLSGLRAREKTPGAFFLAMCDGKFTDEDLNELGNLFTSEYFDYERGRYLADYESTLAQGLTELYYVQDSWQNYERLAPVLDARFNEWKKSKGIP
jgi:hypothetical protein